MAAPARPAPSRSWFYGPVPDLLVGAGVLYLVSIPVLIALQDRFDLAGWPLVVAVVMNALLNIPHYGATLVRVYDQRADRRKYTLFAVHFSLALLALFVVGLHSMWVGSALVTLYLVWSPWHYTGQNYGITLMFLRRRGVAVTPVAKRVLWWSYFLSFALTFIAYNTSGNSTDYAPQVEGEFYRLLRLGLPLEAGPPLAIVFGGAYVASLVAAAVVLIRGGARPRDLLPAAAVVATQAAWFSVPVFFDVANRPLETLPFLILYVSSMHSAQYLWITAYYARRSAHEPTGHFYAKAFLAGGLINVLPGIVFAPALLGNHSWDAGLAILVLSFVNLHHFVLDGAIWKLRDGRVARALLRGPDDEDAEEPASAPAFGGTFARRALWTVGGLCMIVPLLHPFELLQKDSDDLPRVETAARRLAWIGRSSASITARLGDLYTEAGRLDDAETRYREATALDGDPLLVNNLAWFLAVHRTDDPERTRESVELARRALHGTSREDAGVLDTLAAAHAANGDFERAVRTASRAVEIERRTGEYGALDSMEERLALYRAGRPYRAPAPGTGSPPGGRVTSSRSSAATTDEPATPNTTP